ncbi:MAG TPA: alpha/beta hydrolase [Leptolyngbyaceae cyanobacterium M33_DOE_097]|uniref:Alpha/beta hydrolase n=1 Tax=Oscillatoriales cyanobacterium SpSt-418 TaxID=2282169 RepID=A0A7C3KE91_9CYAN|nr:alpha/beta hydrolase [Leptolyngbyaceae cyanobacterium M33_DOE_097]
MLQAHWFERSPSLLISSVIGCFASLAIAVPGQAAEKIYVTYNLLERSISVASLEAYARNGAIDEDLKAYARFASPDVLEQLREVLLTKVELSPVAISQFLYSPQGEVLLRRLGQVIQSESRVAGFSGLRAALILASADPEGLTLLNVLRYFPTRGLRINIDRALDIAGDLQQLVDRTNRMTAVVSQQAIAEAATETPDLASFSGANPRFRGPYTWQKQTLSVVDLSRRAVTSGSSPVPAELATSAGEGRFFQADLYLPNDPSITRPIPMVVISHGLGSDRATFTYLAHHLVSHGFAVLVPEHPGSNAKQLEALVNGTAEEVAEPSEFRDRPLDVTYLLDYLEQQSKTNPQLTGRIDLQQVGVIGQSFGGYTALALAGAPINPESLSKDCTDLDNTLNLSLLLQCRASELGTDLPNLRDPRVKAVIALNPIVSGVLGQASVSQITIPTMILTGNADTIAPAIAEQVQPFLWLSTPYKYLALLDQGTHFSVLDNVEQGGGALALPSEVIGPDPATARRYVNALALAFFKTYVADDQSYRRFLTSSYAQVLSESPLRLSLVRQLSAEQLQAQQ